MNRIMSSSTIFAHSSIIFSVIRKSSEKTWFFGDDFGDFSCLISLKI